MRSPCFPLALFAAASAVTTASAQQPVTFNQHVAPILLRSCAPCHRPGGGAPFSLLTFEDARRRGKTMVRATKARFMPPWHPVEGHGSFVGERRLTAAEIATLERWVADGRPEGPGQPPAAPKFPEGWQLGKPDLVVTMPKAFPVPASGPDIYRNFVVPLNLDRDRWVTAIEVRAGSRQVLHHIIFGIDTQGAARRRDGQDGKPGFDGMDGGAGSRGGNLGTSTAGLGGWAVGGQPQHLPMGLARKLPKGADLILRSHLHPSGKAESEQTTLGLYFTDTPPAHTMVGLQLPPAFGFAAGIDIPAGAKQFTIRDAFTLPVDASLLTVGGHAHYLCRTMQVKVTPPGGEPRSVFYIDNWAFNWQNRYQYREPVALRRGTKIEVTLTYDNSKDNPANPFDPPRRVRWGLQSTDEMGSVTLLMVARRERDSGRLERAIRSAARSSLRSGVAEHPESLLGSLVSRIKMLDKNGDGKIDQSEIPAGWRRYARRFDTNGDGTLDAAEIEAIGR
ncbi:MAG: hypothetical protein H6836_02975 [Planctomycetes bacterium]|nr:hypothetical protein [Planctomycetota bacterium]